MRLVTAHVPNEKGMLSRITSALADAELNVQGFSVDSHRLRILTDAAPAVVAALHDLQVAATEHKILAVKLADRPGRLADLTKRLANADVNIHMAWGTTHGDGGTIYIRVDDHERAKAVLADLPSTSEALI